MISRGDNIKGFVVEERLGSGGFGEVYLVHDSRDPLRKYAMKIIKSELTHDIVVREGFLNEMLNMARLSKHTNILTIVSSLLFNDGEDERVGMVMEYLEGVSLGSHTHRRKKLSPYEAAPVILQILDAIGYAHEMGIIHRDLTPANIMVTPAQPIEYHGYRTMVVKVLDFGLAKVLEGASVTESLSGATLAYAAPERLRRGTQIDHRSDIYSIGVILYELLTGRPPFIIRSLSDAIELISSSHPEPISKFDPSLPAGLNEIILKAMAKQAAERYDSCTQMAAEVEAILPPHGAVADLIDEKAHIGEAEPFSPTQTVTQIVGAPVRSQPVPQPETAEPSDIPSPPSEALPCPEMATAEEQEVQEEAKPQMESSEALPALEKTEEAAAEPPAPEMTPEAGAPKKRSFLGIVSSIGILLLIGAGYLLIEERQEPSPPPELSQATAPAPPVESVPLARAPAAKEEPRPDTLTTSAEDQTWVKILGGAKQEEATCIQETSDGGYVVAGFTASFGKGGGDVWIVKLDGKGSQEWSRTLGGSGREGAASIQQTSDGGFILTGWTSSRGSGGSDIWVLKLDATGKEQWSRAFGGGKDDEGTSIAQTHDGGYILCAWTLSRGSGFSDAMVIRLDANGKELWSRFFGGESFDAPNAIRETVDGGFVFVGYSFSSGKGKGDVWVVRLDRSGKKLWEKTYGGASQDKGAFIEQTSDGGYVLVGSTESGGTDKEDALVIRLDAQGKEIWKQPFGGNRADRATAVHQTPEGGYIVCGNTRSSGSGESDAWLIRLDSQGKELWSRTYGGAKEERAAFVAQTRDGGYITAGWTTSAGSGQSDILVIKVDAEGNLQRAYEDIRPGPAPAEARPEEARQ